MKRVYTWLFPLSLRLRFLLATAAVVTILSLAYGFVAIAGYTVSFDKNTFRLLRGESNMYYTFVHFSDGKLTVDFPPELDAQSPTLAMIYDKHGKLLWQQRQVPWVKDNIRPEWLKSDGFHEIESSLSASRALLSNNNEMQQALQTLHKDENKTSMTHSVAINRYPATATLPALTIAVVDAIPVELKRANKVWNWFMYVLVANILLVIPLLWLAARWSLRPIESLAGEVRELESRHREHLNPETTRELTSLVRNLNQLVTSERERYTKYRTTLTDLTHSLKTPLAVLQSTLRALRTEKMDVGQAESIMLEQISRISGQIGYYLHRASVQGNGVLLNRELHPVAPILDSLASALNKVYQIKGVDIRLDISPEVAFIGEKNDFMEVLGNVLDNACKYCLEFVEVRASHCDEGLVVVVDDDGPGIPEARRAGVFERGQRIDTLRPGQGVGLAVVQDVVEQYDGDIRLAESHLGGLSMRILFRRQDGVTTDQFY